MGKPSAPAAPDPVATANAQTASNEQTAAYNQKLNMIDSTGPNGSVTYSADPSAPGGYSQNTVLSAPQQSIYDQGTAAQGAALGVANQQIGRVSDALGQTVTPQSAGTINQGYGVQSAITGYDPGGAIQTQVTGSGTGQNAIQNAEDAAYQSQTQYLNPQYQQQNEALQSQLTAQGLNQNDAAYQNAVTLQNNAQNQGYQGAMNAATLAGENEQNTLYGQNLSSGEFANSAQAQQNTENAAAAQFYNQGAGQNTSQNEAAAQFGNEAQQQQYNEMMQSQEQPINEFNSLMSSSQVASPTGVSYTPATSANTNVAGIDQNAYQDQLSSYNAQNAANNSVLGGLFSLGSAAISAYSDARLKEDIHRVGTLDSGLPIYAYRFKGSPKYEIGVLAQEAAMSHPHAVHSDPDGVLMVNYGALS